MRIINCSTVYESPWLNMNRTVYVDKTNDAKAWNWAERPGNQKAVMIAAIEHNLNQINKLIITKEFRIPINGHEWGLPAGLIDKDESIEDCAKREFKEETGMTLSNITCASPFVYNSPGMTNESISIVFGTAKGVISSEGLETSEEIKAYKMTKEEIIKLLNKPNVMIGAKAWLLFRLFSDLGVL